MRLAGIITTSLLGFAACGDGQKALLSESLMGQMSVLCETTKFSEASYFPARVQELGLTSDGGDVQADPSLAAELQSSSWVALTDAGPRTTIWRGSYGPGEVAFEHVLLMDPGAVSPSGMTLKKRAFDRAEVCVAHAPTLTRQDGIDLAVAYGLSTRAPKDIWRGESNAAGDSVVTSLRRLTGASKLQWLEIEFAFPADDGDTGVTIIRRNFFSPANSST
jgi:hypothetical protein